MEKFNLARALKGDEVVTGNGFDIISIKIEVSKKDDFDLRAVDSRNMAKFYNRAGFWKIHQTSNYDLFMKYPVEEMKNMNIKPVYTQAMVDAGVMPSVGELVQMRRDYGDDNEFYNGKLIMEDKGIIWFDDDKYGGQLHSSNEVTFKPLTPPIELIDGKAYQFESTNYGGGLGFYNSSDDRFYSNNMYVSARNCTKIKELEVKS